MNNHVDELQLRKKSAEDWLTNFNQLLAAADHSGMMSLCAQTCHWRDIVAFGWDIQTTQGASELASKLLECTTERACTGFFLDEQRTPPRWVTRAGVHACEIIIKFSHKYGHGDGVLRLIDEDNQLKLWTLNTNLQMLEGYQRTQADRRFGGDAYDREFGGRNWLDARIDAQAYEDREPTVLVVGGGQAGVSIAARLTHMGLDTLLIDKNDRIGDNWRNRYHSLTLHNEVFVNHLPFLRFPETWPVYIPKDMLAAWLEQYVDTLEINCWTRSSLEQGRYDEDAQRWDVTLLREGKTRKIKPKHIVLATGVSAIPVMPDIAGLKDYQGTLIHSGQYDEGKDWKDKPVLVVGTGNSGHDVAQDLYAAGAKVSIMQRSPTHIVSLREAQRVYALYQEGPPLEDCDLLATSFPYPVLRRGYELATQMSKHEDHDLLERLSKRGFRLSDGVDNCGFQMSYLQRGGGYYFNVGCSDLIADGDISLLAYQDLESFNPNGLTLKDGTTHDFELVVMATGYKNLSGTTRALLGDEVADRVGQVWGFDEGGELANMWRPTPQPGLWYTAGSLAQCRIFSHYLALQIKAKEEGLTSS